jgi:hypothetical protein
MREIEDEFGRSEYFVYALMNGGAIVRGPLNDSSELPIKILWHVDQVIDKTRFITRTRVDYEVERPLAIRSHCIEEVVAATQVPEGTFICSQRTRLGPIAGGLGLAGELWT